ncbi:MAG: hypothetical protein WCJ58_04065 [bacterium]
MKKTVLRTFLIGLLITLLCVPIVYLMNSNKFFRSLFCCWLMIIPMCTGFITFTKLHSNKEKLVSAFISICPMLIGFSVILTFIILKEIIISPDPNSVFGEAQLLFSVMFILIDLAVIAKFGIGFTILSFAGYKLREKYMKNSKIKNKPV